MRVILATLPAFPRYQKIRSLGQVGPPMLTSLSVLTEMLFFRCPRWGGIAILLESLGKPVNVSTSLEMLLSGVMNVSMPLTICMGVKPCPLFCPMGPLVGRGAVSPCHASIHSHILSAVLDSYPNFDLPSPRAAVGQLLGRRLTYDGGDSSVEPYCEGRVSLPNGTIKPVALAGVLSSDVFANLCPEKMLAEQEVVDFRQKFESVGMYTDIVLSK